MAFSLVVGTTARYKSLPGTEVRQHCTSIPISNVLVAYAWPMVVLALKVADTKRFLSHSK